MAKTDYDRVTAITREKILPKVIDQVSDSHPLLSRWLPKAERQSGGHRIEQVIKYSNSTQGGSYSGAEVLTAEEEQTKTRAYYEWKQYEQPLVVSNIDVAKNGGSEQVFDIVKQSLKEAQGDLKQLMAGSSHGLHGDGTGNSNKDVTGLVAAVDDSTNVSTYGDIDRSTYSWWQSDYTASLGSLSLSGLASVYTNIASGSDQPTIIVTTESVWNSYEALLQPQFRYAIASGQADLSFEGGAKALRYRGTPLIADEFCPSGYMYMLNEDYIKFVTLKHPNYSSDKMGFAMRDLEEPSNQDASIGYIFWYGNLVNVQPRRSAAIRGVS